jgi:ABC-type glycerol-3-phosphate transport system substrate-binding protein
LAVHGQQGDFPEWEAYLKFVNLLKEMTPYFPMGYEGTLDYRQLFRQGRVAMYMEGNWAVADFKASPPPFEFSWLHYPIITKDIWPAAPEKIVRIQGAWGAMQYHIPGYLAETDLDKISVIMDWLRFSSKPDNVGAICRETGLVPLTKGARGLDELEPFYEPYDRAVPYQSWGTLSASAMSAEYTLLQAYLPSDMTDSAFQAMAQETWDKEIAKVLESNPDWKI